MAIKKGGYVCTCRRAACRSPFPKDKVFHNFTIKDYIESGIVYFGAMVLFALPIVVPIILF